MGSRWFHWSEIESAFWGARQKDIPTEESLNHIKASGGVYVLAWSLNEPKRKRPHTVAAVKYIGETAYFKARMGAFGTSAGFWGKRDNGHSAGWSWEEGCSANLWVAFFQLPWTDLPAHLATGLRKWIEAVALEEHRSVRGVLPAVNTVKRNVVVQLDD
jgi:hypothetical protein